MNEDEIKNFFLEMNEDSLPKNPIVISIDVIPSNEIGTINDIIIALDSNGIINFFYIDNNLNQEEKEGIIEIKNKTQKYIQPTLSFFLDDYIRRQFTSMSIHNNKIFLTGNFETFSFSYDEIAQKIKDNLHNKSTKNKTPIFKIDTNKIIKYNDYRDYRKINGCENKNNYLLTFSDDGNLYLFDIADNSKLLGTTFLHTNYLKKREFSINSAKIDQKNNVVVYGGSGGYVYFSNISSLTNQSIFSIESNTFYHNEIDCKETTNFSMEIHSIIIADYYYLISCNDFIIKYSTSLNSVTNVFVTNTLINTVYKDTENVIAGCVGRNVLKFPISISFLHPTKLKSDEKTTSVTCIKKCSLLGNYYYLTGGNSNIINIFEEKNNEESILSLIL